MCEDGSDPGNNSLNGPLLLGSIKDTTKELKDYSTKTLKGLKKVRSRGGMLFMSFLWA